MILKYIYGTIIIGEDKSTAIKQGQKQRKLDKKKLKILEKD